MEVDRRVKSKHTASILPDIRSKTEITESSRTPTPRNSVAKSPLDHPSREIFRHVERCTVLAGYPNSADIMMREPGRTREGENLTPHQGSRRLPSCTHSRRDHQPNGAQSLFSLKRREMASRQSRRTWKLHCLLLSAALVLIVSTISGCSHSQKQPYPEARLNFTKMPDGDAPTMFGNSHATVTTTPSGDPSARFHIQNGLLTTTPTVDGPTASYLTSASLGTPVTNLGAGWVFTDATGPSASVLLFVSQNVISPPYALRLQITRVGWSVGVQSAGELNANDGEILASARFATPLKDDGKTTYRFSVSLAGERVELELPTGERQVVRDRRFADWAGSYVTFGSFQPNGASGSRIGFADVWAESRMGG